MTKWAWPPSVSSSFSKKERSQGLTWSHTLLVLYNTHTHTHAIAHTHTHTHTHTHHTHFTTLLQSEPPWLQPAHWKRPSLSSKTQRSLWKHRGMDGYTCVWGRYGNTEAWMDTPVHGLLWKHRGIDGYPCVGRYGNTEAWMDTPVRGLLWKHRGIDGYPCVGRYGNEDGYRTKMEMMPLCFSSMRSQMTLLSK